jgi:hypothetical protein
MKSIVDENSDFNQNPSRGILSGHRIDELLPWKIELQPQAAEPAA